MVTAALLSSDQRLAFQVQTWMKELSETVRLETYSDLAAFQAKVNETLDDENAAKSAAADEAVIDAEDIGSGKSTDEKALRLFRLLIVDLELLTSKHLSPLAWTAEIKKILADRGKSDPIFPTKVMFMAFEGGEWGAENMRHPDIDDLVLKPLDRSVFLQKVELLVADKLGIKPTFLFRQSTAMTIEAGKDAMIDEISDFAVAIRNPAPLANGVFAALHSDIFGSQGDSRILARVYKSERHPTMEGEFLVRFNFFGPTSAQQANVKKFMRDHHVPTRLKNDSAMPHGEPETPFNRIAVIDMNPDVFEEIRSALKDNYHGLGVTYFPSYARFLATLADLNKVPEAAPTAAESDEGALKNSPESASESQGAERPWPSKKPLIYRMSTPAGELMSFESSFPAGDRILGKTAKEWLERPSDWLSGLEEADREEFEQLIHYVMNGGDGRAYVRIRDEANTTFFFAASATVEKSGEEDGHGILKIKLTDMAQADWEMYSAVKAGAVELNPADFRFDAIYIDGSLIRGDLLPWYDGLEEILLKTGVMQRGEAMPKVIVLADERSKTRPEAYQSKVVSDFMFKPLDRKTIALKAKTVVQDLIPLKDDPHVFVPAEIPAKLAKDVKMEEISEYGLSISHKTPFKWGVTMRFFSELFGEGVGGVIGRCSHCEKVKQDKTEYYICHFIFFGASDETLKRIRTWIREDYVHRKEGS